LTEESQCFRKSRDEWNDRRDALIVKACNAFGCGAADLAFTTKYPIDQNALRKIRAILAFCYSPTNAHPIRRDAGGIMNVQHTVFRTLKTKLVKTALQGTSADGREEELFDRVMMIDVFILIMPVHQPDGTRTDPLEHALEQICAAQTCARPRALDLLHELQQAQMRLAEAVRPLIFCTAALATTAIFSSPSCASAVAFSARCFSARAFSSASCAAFSASAFSSASYAALFLLCKPPLLLSAGIRGR